MEVFSHIMVLFAIIIIGFYAGKRNIISPDIKKGIIDLLLRITLPLMIFSSFNFEFSVDMLKNSGRVLLYSFIIHFTLIVLSSFLYRGYTHEKKAVLRFITTFSNCGFMGYPIIRSIFGSEGVFYAAIYNISFNILVWTAGVMFFTSSGHIKNIKKVLLNPCVVSVVVGMLAFAAQIPIPNVVWSICEMVGDVTTPLSMMVIGVMLSEIKLKDIIAGWELYYVSFVRLVAAPALVYGAFRLIGIQDMVFKVCVIITAMPGAVNTAIISDKYGGDSALASKCVFTTTLLSAVTIPLILMLL